MISQVVITVVVSLHYSMVLGRGEWKGENRPDEKGGKDYKNVQTHVDLWGKGEGGGETSSDSEDKGSDCVASCTPRYVPCESPLDVSTAQVHPCLPMSCWWATNDRE